MPHRTLVIAHDGGRPFNGYLSLPRSGSGPGLILGQEIFGVNPRMRRMADLYADEGHVGIERHLDAASAITCPLLLHVAGQDAYTPPDVIVNFRGDRVCHEHIYLGPSVRSGAGRGA